MTQNVWCRFFNIHKYEVLKEEELKNSYGILIGKIIISRCNNCGKIRIKFVATNADYLVDSRGVRTGK